MSRPCVIDLRAAPDLLCQVCRRDGTWQLLRCRDAKRAWSCDEHLARVMTALRHDRGMTRITVYVSGVEAAAAGSALEG